MFRVFGYALSHRGATTSPIIRRIVQTTKFAVTNSFVMDFEWRSLAFVNYFAIAIPTTLAPSHEVGARWLGSGFKQLNT